MSNPVLVTDHALLRYMQRVLDIDVEQLRGMVAESVGRHQGAPSVRAIGARFLMINGRVVTTIDDKAIPSHMTLLGLMQRAAEEKLP
ncbi:hypothetical protein EH240_19900 [Mesorhizobium tamadayense]|uniref:Uncharacterized protein n=1 Tax=Mesorhizobium tamadayense TaxID=425306 RepID=A0A3P3FIX2_9HYPH|nr:hypothetical protein [Mesorhizobium tamadayense]RRH98062.1 hypothetical protein EH240_19900 [Mesorhizobium tamadayense]